ncbi:MAG: hypothetical protein ACRBBU_12105 [Pseudooceanicola sp.]
MTSRAILSLWLATILTLTGQAAAIARGQADSADWIEICSGSGVVMIGVDANGDPTGETVYCPENAAALFGAIAVAPLVADFTSSVSQASTPPNPPLSYIAIPHPPKARGPPVF